MTRWKAQSRKTNAPKRRNITKATRQMQQHDTKSHCTTILYRLYSVESTARQYAVWTEPLQNTKTARDCTNARTLANSLPKCPHPLAARGSTRKTEVERITRETRSRSLKLRPCSPAEDDTGAKTSMVVGNHPPRGPSSCYRGRVNFNSVDSCARLVPESRHKTFMCRQGTRFRVQSHLPRCELAMPRPGWLRQVLPLLPRTL